MTTNTLKIDKLSEKNLLDVLHHLFPIVTSIDKKTFKTKSGKRMIVDYYMEFAGKQFAFEFDGPTHFNRTKTQMRDLQLSEYCSENDVVLIRIPYFIQIDDDTICWLFGRDFANHHDLLGKVESSYPHGFIDKECVLPGDYNAFGVKLFLDICDSLISSEHQFINVRHSIHTHAHQRDKTEFLGIDSSPDAENFWRNAIHNML